jgi:uncharacterized membrane protein
MIGARDLQRGEELELAHLLSGLQHNAQGLVALGGINLVAQILINILVISLIKMAGGGTLIKLIQQHEQEPTVLAQAMSNVDLRLLFDASMVGLVLSLLLLMAMIFAPMLVIFQHTTPVGALKTSFVACVRNLIPLIVCGLLLLLLAVVASMPMMLGWLVLLPIIIASIYVIYIDLFPPETETPQTIEGEVISNGE